MRWRMLAMVVAAATVVASGCGGGGGGDTSTGAGTSAGTGAGGEAMTKLTVGVIPIADVAPLYLGIQKGFFRAQKLDVEPQLAQGGAAITAGVVSGAFDFGFAATEPLILAKAKGLPVKIVTNGNTAATDPKKVWTGLMVPKDGPVKSAKDLEGETIAANALQSTPHLATLSMLDKQGVDISKLKFTEVGFPDMPAALQSGQVAAVTGAEPFLPQMLDHGARSLGGIFYKGFGPGTTIGTYFTLDKRIQSDPDLVKRFATAMNKSLDYAQAHQDEARKAITTYAKIPAGTLSRIKLTPWGSELNRPSIQKVADLCRKYGFIDKAVDTSQIIWSGAAS